MEEDVFLTYCIGMGLAGLLSIPYRPAFMLRVFYAAVIVVAHFQLANHSHELGRDFYLYCGLFQFSILICALFVACSATLPVAILAFLACIINTISYYNYPSHDGIWTVYFDSINGIQTAQIACLIFFSPICVRVIRRYTNNEQGAQSWMLRQIYREM